MPAPPPPPHIPAEMVEEILLNLPVKSLLRFSSASKSWNSTIFESGFVKRYRSRRAALAGRERIALRHKGYWSSTKEASTLLSSASLNNLAKVDATSFDCPFFRGYKRFTIVASCDDLWLARLRAADAYNYTFFICNPCYKQVPNSSNMIYRNIVYGLGYECVEDDYKILKVVQFAGKKIQAELYSLRSDSWRYIEDLPTTIGNGIYGCCGLVSGKLHFVSRTYDPMTYFITCFDLLTEKFGEVVLPNYSLESLCRMDVSVLREMLSVCINYCTEYCDIWVMKEYGVVGSWTKKFSIAYSFSNHVSLFPLDLYENGDIVMRFTGWGNSELGDYFVYRADEKSSMDVKFLKRGAKQIGSPFVYVDSLVAPAMWVKTRNEEL